MKALHKMTVAELHKTITVAEQLLAAREKQELAELRQRLAAMATKAGFDFNDLMRGQHKSRGKAGVKFEECAFRAKR